MLRIQAETVGTDASGVKKKSRRQLLDAKKETDTKPISSDPQKDGAKIVWRAGKTERKLKQILFHCLNAFEEAHEMKRFGHVFIGTELENFIAISFRNPG